MRLIRVLLWFIGLLTFSAGFSYAGDRSVGPRPCPLAGCGAPAFRPYVISLLPANNPEFLTVDDRFARNSLQVDSSENPSGSKFNLDAKFSTISYTDDQITDLLDRISNDDKKVGGLVIYKSGDFDSVVERKLVALSENNMFPVIVIYRNSGVYNYNILNKTYVFRKSTPSADPSYIGDDARNTFVEWWGAWKGDNLKCECKSGATSLANMK
jgi:hypothetical protein